MSYNSKNPNSQATMANSEPVVIASNQSAIPISNANLDALATNALGNNTFASYAHSFRVDLSTYNHSKAFKLLDARATRKEFIVLNHGTIGSFHIFYTTTPTGNVPPLDGVFMSPIELFFHDTWVGNIYNGEVWAMWHEPEEKIITPVAVTLTAASDLVTRTAHGLTDHAEVLFNTIVTTTGIVINTIYYVIYVSANTFKLATTKANVRANTPIDLLTGDGSGTITHSLPFTGFLQVTEIYS